MVRKIIIAIMILVFLAGLGFFLYPYAQGALIDREIQENAEDFHSRVEVQPTTGNTSTVIIDTTEPTEEQLYPDLWADMTAYNETIYAEGQSGLSCAYDYQKPSFILADYGLEDEVFGVISIPAMDLNMPPAMNGICVRIVIRMKFLAYTVIFGSAMISAKSQRCTQTGSLNRLKKHAHSSLHPKSRV